jgi:hypothetical protein
LIVRPAGSTLYLITQPDHAALARRVMERWAPLRDAARRVSILHAIEQHDNGWRETDDAPIVDSTTAHVFDFITVPACVRQGVWPRGVARLGSDPWAAALVAQHALTVYDRYRSDPEWEVFFPQLEAIRDTHVRATALTFEDLTRDYGYVRLGDLISLTFCAGWDDAQTFDGWTVRRDGDRVHVTPDGFDGETVGMTVPARAIPNVPYASDAALRHALRASPQTSLQGVVSGGP